MALIWTESFTPDFLSSGSFAAPTNSSRLNANGSFIMEWSSTFSSSARTGTRCSSGIYGVGLGVADQDDLLIVGFAGFGINSLGANRSFVELWGDGGTTQHVAVGVNAAGLVTAWRGGAGGTVLGSASAASFPDGNYYYVETKVRLSDTVGSVEVRVDEKTVLNLTGIDTKNGGTGTVLDRIRIRGDQMTREDDVYICNEQGSTCNDFLGAVKIELALPIGNGNSSQGVGSDGNSTDNYALVDEATLSLVSNFWSPEYVDFASTGDKDTYLYSDLPERATTAVKAVVVCTYAQKSDAGARDMNAIARLSGTETTSTIANLVNGAPRIFHAAFETKPGGGAWTVADVNNAEFGVSAV